MTGNIHTELEICSSYVLPEGREITIAQYIPDYSIFHSVAEIDLLLLAHFVESKRCDITDTKTTYKMVGGNCDSLLHELYLHDPNAEKLVLQNTDKLKQISDVADKTTLYMHLFYQQQFLPKEI